MPPPEPQVVARLTYRGVGVTLTEGQQVRLGRSSSSDLRIGAGNEDPEDLGVSRHAATVSVRDGRVWVRNDSASQPVYLVPASGPTRTLDGEGEIASLPEARLTVQFRGRILTHDVDVEVEGGSGVDHPPPDSDAEPATQFLLDLSPAERRILTALAEPLLTERGDDARPASYAQGAERTFLSRSRVENCVADLVRRFSAAGIPNLEGPEAKDNLCRYAVRSGSITRADLALLDPPS
jgi:hypothetical protein